MEEPLEAFETPKQDKMISLIAWLIVASLLFYLSVVTFEGFLRLSPDIRVVENMDMENPDTANPGDVEPGFVLEQETTTSETQVEPGYDMSSESSETDIPSLAGIEVEPGVEQVSEGLEGILENSQEIALSQNEQYTEEVEPVVDQVAQNVSSESLLVSEVEVPDIASVVQEATAELGPVYQLAMERVFESRAQAFDALKKMSFGDLDLEFELVQRSSGFHVLLGGELSRSELDQLKQYLSIRNNNLGLQTLDVQGVENLLSSRVVNTSPAPTQSLNREISAERTTVPLGADFYTRAGALPFTIQVGSFLQEVNARQLSNDLQQKGYSSAVESKLQRGVAHYRVLLGNYENRRVASREAAQISEKENLPVYVREAIQ